MRLLEESDPHIRRRRWVASGGAGGQSGERFPAITVASLSSLQGEKAPTGLALRVVTGWI